MAQTDGLVVQMIESKKLRGLSVVKADLYGKPHLGARYTAKTGVTDYVRESDYCVICGKPASNVHHVPNRGAHIIEKDGEAALMRPPLFALCGSGTTGCHGKVHNHEISITWKWDDHEDRERWLNGELDYPSNDPRLFERGCWQVITERETVFIRGFAPEHREIKQGDRVQSVLSTRQAIVEELTDHEVKLRMDDGEAEWLERDFLGYWRKV